MIVHWVDVADVWKHDFPWWWRGRHNVEWLHPDVASFRPTGSNLLKKRRLSHLLKNASVPVFFLAWLLDDRNACCVGSLRVAAEGLDADLLLAYSPCVEGRNGTCYADEVVWGLDGVAVEMGRNDPLDAALGRVGYQRDTTNATEIPKDQMVWRYKPGGAEGTSASDREGATGIGRDDAVGRGVR